MVQEKQRVDTLFRNRYTQIGSRTPNANVRKAAPTGGSMERKMSIGARIWICLCLAASLAMAIVFIVLFALSDRSAPFAGLTAGQLAAIVAPLFLTAAGYLILLCGKKAGFYVILAVAVFCAVFALIAKMLLPALFSFLNPLITWLLLRKRWDRWHEIDKQRMAVRRKSKKLKRRKTALLLAALPWTGFLGGRQKLQLNNSTYNPTLQPAWPCTFSS